MPETPATGPLTPELLRLPAAHGVRVVAIALAEKMLASQRRLEDGSDDGLHDVRVAARHLRSWLRAFRPELSDTVRGKTRRRLGALTRATNEARDAEVALAFIAELPKPPARARAGVRAMVKVLETQRLAHDHAIREALERDLVRTVGALTHRLSYYWERHRIDEPVSPRPTSEVLADAVRHQAGRLEAALARLGTTSRAGEIHRTRIAAKRLRYLLEPLGGLFGADEAVAELKLLQQQLGDARDAHRIAMRIVREMGERAAADARRHMLATLGLSPDAEDDAPGLAELRRGLLEIARCARDAREARMAEFHARWGERQRAEILALAQSVTARLGAS